MGNGRSSNPIGCSVRGRSESVSIPIMAVLRKLIGSFPKKLRDHALGVGIPGSHPDTSIRIDASNARERAMPTGGPRRNLAIPRNSYAYLRRSGRAILRYTLELLIQYWFSVVTLP